MKLGRESALAGPVVHQRNRRRAATYGDGLQWRNEPPMAPLSRQRAIPLRRMPLSSAFYSGANGGGELAGATANHYG